MHIYTQGTTICAHASRDVYSQTGSRFKKNLTTNCKSNSMICRKILFETWPCMVTGFTNRAHV